MEELFRIAYKKTICVVGIISLILPVTLTSKAQTVSAGSIFEEYLRNQDLRGKLSQSFSVGNLKYSSLDSLKYELPDIYYPTQLLKSDFLGGSSISVLPVNAKFRFNSHHPFGFNDGAMMPTKGFQSLFNTGINVNLGPLEIQLAPDFLLASNDNFESLSDNRNDNLLGSYYKFFNLLDQPESYKNFKKAYPGQSYVRLNFGSISLGYSTENLKWGPGIHNSLILGNNVPGFQHGTIQTSKPIRTAIGNFEAQIIGGRLDGSGELPLKNRFNSSGVDVFTPYPSDWRYLSAMNINYQPKWLPNLYFGFTRSFMAYGEEINSFNDYFPLLVKLQKKDGDQDSYDRDQRLSLYSRMVFPKANAEVYFEYALNDNSFDFRDFIGSPDHGRAYLFGFSKLISLSKKEQFISLNAEITQLSQSVDRLVREAGGFYQHAGVTHGYTHLGQSIGAGSGTGSNVQGLQIKWFDGLTSLGVLFQRIEQNVDFYDMYVKDFNGMSRKWVDYGFGFTGQWNYKNFLLNGKLQGVQSLNYQWRMKDYDPSMSYYVPNNDVFNLHAELGISYRF